MLERLLILSAVLFCIGLYGALSRRHVVAVLISIEIMFNAVNVAAIAFSRFTVPAGLTDTPVVVTQQAVQRALTGQMLSVFVITAAAAEIALGLALVIVVYRRRDTVDVTDLTEMSG